MISTMKYLTWSLKKVIFGKNEPLISWVSLTQNKVNSFEDIMEDIRRSYSMGARVLYITEVDYYLWPESHTVNDLVAYAKETGFSKVHVFTNGTTIFPQSADVIWIGIDELKKDFSVKNGKTFFNTIKNIFRSSHKKILVDYMITKSNIKHLDEALSYFSNIKKLKGIFINFEAPREEGAERENCLSEEEKIEVLDQLISKRREYKILNSVAGLEALKYNCGVKKVLQSGIVGNEGSGISGYGLLVELSQAFKLKLSAVLNSFNFI